MASWRTGAVPVSVGGGSAHRSLSCGVPWAPGWLSLPLSAGTPWAAMPPECGTRAEPGAGATPGLPVAAGSPACCAPWHQALQAGHPRPGHQLHCPPQPCAGPWAPPAHTLLPAPRTPTPAPPEGETTASRSSPPAPVPGVPHACWHLAPGVPPYPPCTPAASPPGPPVHDAAGPGGPQCMLMAIPSASSRSTPGSPSVPHTHR